MSDKIMALSYDVNPYIDKLIDQVFSLLPLFEENKCDFYKQRAKILNHKINGFLSLYNYDSIITLEILSLLKEIECVKTHYEIRYCVLKICSLLSSIKVVNVE